MHARGWLIGHAVGVPVARHATGVHHRGDRLSWVLHTTQEDIRPSVALWRAMSVPFGLASALILAGTSAYRVLEGWSLLDSLWMSVITLTTIGYGEVHPLSDPGRLFTIVYIFMALGIYTRGVTTAARYVADGDLARAITARRHRRELSEMRNHYIVIGLGRLGREVAEDLTAQGLQVVGIDLTERDNLPEGLRVIIGDATQDETLEEAGITRAAGVAVATPNDAINVFITLTVRQMNPDVRIEVRVEDEGSGYKARRAGATGILRPFTIGGRRMAHALLRPGSMAFLEHLTSRTFQDLHMEDITIEQGARADGHSLRQLDLRNRWRVMVVAVRNRDDDQMVIPSPDTTLAAGDTMVVIGEPGDVARFIEDTCHGDATLPGDEDLD